MKEKETRTCPFCAEEIKRDAVKYKHCGEFLDQKPKTKWYFQTNWLVISFLVVGPFALPLFWFNPRYDRNVKIVISIVVIAASYYATLMLSHSYRTLTEFYQMLNQSY